MELRGFAARRAACNFPQLPTWRPLSVAVDPNFIGSVVNALPIDKMVAAPLMAAIQAQVAASKAFADFFMTVCIAAQTSILLRCLAAISHVGAFLSIWLSSIGGNDDHHLVNSAAPANSANCAATAREFFRCRSPRSATTRERVEANCIDPAAEVDAVVRELIDQPLLVRHAPGAALPCCIAS